MDSRHKNAMSRKARATQRERAQPLAHDYRVEHFLDGPRGPVKVQHGTLDQCLDNLARAYPWASYRRAGRSYDALDAASSRVIVARLVVTVSKRRAG